MNKAFLMGHLTRDPEARKIPSGKTVVTCGIATNENYVDAQGVKQQKVQFHNLVIWDKKGETFANFLQKGSKILVEGKISNTTYQGNDGVKKYKSDVVVSNFHFLDSKPTEPEATPPPTAQEEPTPPETPTEPSGDINVEDIPF